MRQGCALNLALRTTVRLSRRLHLQFLRGLWGLQLGRHLGVGPMSTPEGASAWLLGPLKRISDARLQAFDARGSTLCRVSLRTSKLMRSEFGTTASRRIRRDKPLMIQETDRSDPGSNGRYLFNLGDPPVQLAPRRAPRLGPRARSMPRSTGFPHPPISATMITVLKTLPFPLFSRKYLASGCHPPANDHAIAGLVVNF